MEPALPRPGTCCLSWTRTSLLCDSVRACYQSNMIEEEVRVSTKGSRCGLSVELGVGKLTVCARLKTAVDLISFVLELVWKLPRDLGSCDQRNERRDEEIGEIEIDE